ncbi:hypothetical protein T07_3257 [Trichinella nelsoni]|uniref:Uncharacterized protein n=1 Tax=Trichinella nelsoni TaxID=6336 RepID=A0A0V0RZT1_9BILA|nr:hypothetical protein T07_3257 [Trichinella nelsoni]
MINHNAIDRSPKSHTTNNCYVPPHCRTLPHRQITRCSVPCGRKSERPSILDKAEKETSPQQVLATRRERRRSCSVGAWCSVRGRQQCDLSPWLSIYTYCGDQRNSPEAEMYPPTPMENNGGMPNSVLTFVLPLTDDNNLSTVFDNFSEKNLFNCAFYDAYLERPSQRQDTILYYVEARVNSGQLIFIGDETRSENMLSPSHFLMDDKWSISAEMEIRIKYWLRVLYATVMHLHIFQCLLDLEIVCIFTDANQDIMEKNIEGGMNHISDKQCFT